MQKEKGKIPVETDTVCNLLPIPVDINGPVIASFEILMICLLWAMHPAAI